jgi:hypothetical protein
MQCVPLHRTDTPIFAFLVLLALINCTTTYVLSMVFLLVTHVYSTRINVGCIITVYPKDEMNYIFLHYSLMHLSFIHPLLYGVVVEKMKSKHKNSANTGEGLQRRSFSVTFCERCE